MGDGETGLAGVFPKRIQQVLAFLDREANDIGVRAAAQEQRLQFGIGISADQRMPRPRSFANVGGFHVSLAELAGGVVSAVMNGDKDTMRGFCSRKCQRYS